MKNKSLLLWITVLLLLSPAQSPAAAQSGNNTERVSLNSDGSQSTYGDSYFPAVSGDGRYVAFGSQANLVGNASWGGVYVYDRQTHQITLVSVKSDGS